MTPMDEVLARIPNMLAARYSLLYVLTPEEERVERGIERVCAQHGLALYRWRRTSGLRGPELASDDATRDPEAALARVAAIPAPALFVMEDLHANLGDPAVVRRLRDLDQELGARRQAVVVLSSTLVIPAELEKDFAVLDVPLPTRKEVSRVLAVLLQSQRVELAPDLFEAFVTASLGLTEKEIKRAYARVLVDGKRFAASDLSLLIDEKARLLRKSRFLEFIRPEVGAADIGGLGNLKDWLRQRQTGFSDRARAFGLPEPKGLFLLGVQGCGKSLSAKAVADLWRVPLLRLDVAALFAGRAEEGLRDTIRIAESIAPAVLWIDEIEKAFLQDQGGGRVFGAFLTWMQEKSKPVFVVATANEVRALPPELLRKGRFDEIFYVSLPDAEARKQIFQIHGKARLYPDFSDDELALLAARSQYFTGAEIEQCLNDAIFLWRDRVGPVPAVLEAMETFVPLASRRNHAGELVLDLALRELEGFAVKAAVKFEDLAGAASRRAARDR